MATAAPRFCTAPGCGVLVQGGSRCPKHFVARRGASRVDRMRGRKWMALRERVLRREPRCAECLKAGRLRLAAQVDHIVALEDGGTDDEDNLQGLCLACHVEKTRRERLARA